MVSVIPTVAPLPSPLLSLSSLLSAVTTLSATFLIALKIVLITRTNRMQHSYSKIIEILIQSAGLVSFVMLSASTLGLISNVHPFDVETKMGAVLYQVALYISRLQAPVAVRLP